MRGETEIMKLQCRYCFHSYPNGKCKFGWKPIANRCPAPLTGFREKK